MLDDIDDDLAEQLMQEGCPYIEKVPEGEIREPSIRVKKITGKGKQVGFIPDSD